MKKFGIEATRNHLINLIKSCVQNCIIVFDGKEEYPNPNVKNVVFTRNEKADDYIKRFVREYRNKGEIIVITNDRSIRNYVERLGAKSISVDKFFETNIKPIATNRKPEKPNQELADRITRKIIEEMNLKEFEN